MTSAEFNSELTKLRPVMYGFSRSFTKDREEAWDLVQDTTLKALRYQSRFQDDVNLKGWLFTIMRNTFINQYRKDVRFRKAHDVQSQFQYLNTEDVSGRGRPESDVDIKETWKIVNSCREELATPFKMYLSGYKYHEIAKHLDIPLGTVKNRIFQARQEIQSKLTGYSS